MEIISKVRHTVVTDDIKAYAEEKVGKHCHHYLGDGPAIVAEIEFDDINGPKGGLDKKVDLTITLPRQHLPIHLEQADATYQEAVDKLLDRLDKALVKYKEKLT